MNNDIEINGNAGTNTILKYIIPINNNKINIIFSVTAIIVTNEYLTTLNNFKCG